MFHATLKMWWRFCYDTTIRKIVTDADDIKPMNVMRNGRRAPSVELDKLADLHSLEEEAEWLMLVALMASILSEEDTRSSQDP